MVRQSLLYPTIALSALALAACVGPAEYGKTEDLFLATDTGRAGRTAHLKAALVMTQNSDIAFKHLANAHHLYSRAPLAPAHYKTDLDPKRIADDVLRFLKDRYAEVVRVGNLDEAQSSNADLIIVWDMKVQVGERTGANNTVSIALQLLYPARDVIDVVYGNGQLAVPWPATVNFAGAWQRALRELGTNVSASTKLTAYVATITKRPEPTAGPAAMELAFWESVKGSTNPADFHAYLQKFPSGSFAALARTRLSGLGEVAPVRLTPLALPADGRMDFGRYHALVIGINNYRNVTPLKTAIHDARMVAEVLQREYGFQITLLADPTRNQVLDAFDELRRTLTEMDNLLIYYAGHGHLDVDSDRGFWLPADADPNRRANWLSNSDIADVVRATRAKHVLVVADSCYAGTLTRSLSVQMTALDDFARLAQRRARTALVSGGLEPVEDAGGGNHSVFAKAFLDQLRANTGVVDMSQIFSAMRRQVILSAQQTPQYGDIRQTGHEGGDFIFVRSTSVQRGIR